MILKMAKKLDSLALRNDDKGKQIRCLIVENEVTGMVTKIRNHHQFEEVIATTNPDYLTKVYEPTIKQRDELLDLIKNNVVTDDNGETRVEIEEEKVLLTMLDFTDIEIDKRKNKHNSTLLKQIAKNPTTTFIFIKQELDVLLLEIIAMYHSMMTAYNNIPEEISELPTVINNLEADIKKKEQSIKEKQKEIEKLKEKLEGFEYIN